MTFLRLVPAKPLNEGIQALLIPIIPGLLSDETSRKRCSLRSLHNQKSDSDALQPVVKEGSTIDPWRPSYIHISHQKQWTFRDPARFKSMR